METINNATTAVKNAIWGEGENPNTAGGNTTENTQGQNEGRQVTNKNGPTEVHKSMIDDTVTETKPYSGKTESDPMAKDSYDPNRDQSSEPTESNTKDTDRRPEGPTSTGGQPQGANLTGQQGTNKESFSNSNEPNTGFGGAGAQPSVGADPSSGQQDTQKHQGADRPNEDPDTASQAGGRSGPQGGAGGPGGGPGGMKLPDADQKSHSEGTGEKYEKSTGLHADGGDFDATRPGAAREADRLMEEKGIKHGVDKSSGTTDDTDKKEKKWYGVDHSGFGGHGSHTNENKKSSISSAAGQDASGRDHGSVSGESKDLSHSHTNTSEHSSSHPNPSGKEPIDSATGSDDVTGHKSLGEKIKAKLPGHH